MAVVVWVALSMNASARSAKSFSTATLVAAADYLPCGEGCSALANQASAFCFRVGDQTLVGEGSSYLHEGKFAGAKEFAGKQIQLRFSRRSIWIKPPDSSVMKLSRGSQFENFQDAGCIREVRKPLLAAANAHRRPAKVPGTAFALAGTGKGDRYLWYQCDLDSDKAEIACRSWYRNGDLLGRDWYCARTAAGEPVLSTTGQPIPVPPGEVTIGASGVLSVAGGVVATVGVFTFPPGVQLTPEGANRYVPPEGTIPVPAKDDSVHQGAIESANQDVIQGSLDLIVMQRQAEMMQKALTIFHTEFNKTATEDLPRV